MTLVLGEVSKTDPAMSISPRHDFATYFGQSFVALPGLASSLTFNIGSGPGDGIDFKVLLATTSIVAGLAPIEVVFESPIYTWGSEAGLFGTNLGGPGRADVTVSLGNTDLKNGQTYAWLLDTVAGADGIAGYGVISYRHPLQPDVPGNSTVLVYDLETQTPNQPWINSASIDLAFRMEFIDGGASDPDLPVIRTLPAADGGAVPEPATLAMWGGLGLVGAAYHRRKRA